MIALIGDALVCTLLLTSTGPSTEPTISRRAAAANFGGLVTLALARPARADDIFSTVLTEGDTSSPMPQRAQKAVVGA
jgi:hypothetical protein